jgi:hypothetical protein
MTFVVDPGFSPPSLLLVVCYGGSLGHCSRIEGGVHIVALNLPGKINTPRVRPKYHWVAIEPDAKVDTLSAWGVPEPSA